MRMNWLGSRYPRLELELLRPRAVRKFLGHLSLAIGIALAALVAVQYLNSKRQIALTEANMGLALNARKYLEIPVDSDEAEAVQESIARLNMPWDTLFQSLEAVSPDKINLVSVESDPERSSVKITAEAPEVYAMLQYARDLATQPGLQGVQLVQYEIAGDGPEQPVRFIMTAAWGSLQ